MSASPTLIQTIPESSRTSASIDNNPSPLRRQSALGLNLERSDSVSDPVPAFNPAPSVAPSASTLDTTPSSLPTSDNAMAPLINPGRMLDLKGKGKQKAVEEKEEGEISDEDEEYVIRDVDSWRPPVKDLRHPLPRNPSLEHQRNLLRQSYKRKDTRRYTQSSAISSSVSLRAKRSVSRSPITPQLSPPSPSSHRHSIISDTNTTTSSTPSSDSLALPESVNPDEAAQYMDIIRNLITDGISPDVLIKRGATRKYVLAVCEDLANFDKSNSVDAQYTRLVDHNATSESTALVHDDISPVIDMTRSVSSSSSSSVEISDAIDQMLSPRPAQRPVPSSSWKPTVVSSSSVSYEVPLVRTDTYKPEHRPAQLRSTSSITAHGPTQLSHKATPFVAPLPPRPVQLSHKATPFVTALPPRPVSTYVAPGTRAESNVPRPDGIDRNTSSSIATPNLGLDALLPSSSLLQTSTATETDASSSPTLAIETLAERKKRVLESMKRARKLNAATPASSASQASVPSAPDAPMSRLSTASRAASPAMATNFDQEVDALEREVMGLQAMKSDIKDETEEGEITPPTALSVLPPTEPLPARATLNSSTASTNHTNGVRLNRASKRPNAEDLMENRVKSAKPSYPIRRRPFGRPLPYKYLLVSLDDSDDEKDTRSAPQPAPPSDAERQRLEEDIKRLRARIEERRLAKAAKLKAEKEDIPPTVEGPPESAEEDMDIDDDVPAGPTVTEAVSLEASPEISTSKAKPVDLAAHSSTIPVGDDVIDSNMGSTSSPVSEVIMTPQTSTATSKTSTTEGSSAYSFRPYRSLLRRYPQLSSPVITRSKSVPPPQASKAISQSGLDHELMSSIILTSAIKRNANVVVCGAEAAGGTCADRSCHDIHLGRDLGRPHENSIIEYLDQISDNKYDRNTLKDSLGLAKKALRKVLANDKVGTGEPVDPAVKTPSRPNAFSLPVAEQLVVLVGEVLQARDDKSRSRNE